MKTIHVFIALSFTVLCNTACRDEKDYFLPVAVEGFTPRYYDVDDVASLYEETQGLSVFFLTNEGLAIEKIPRQEMKIVRLPKNMFDVIIPRSADSVLLLNKRSRAAAWLTHDTVLHFFTRPNKYPDSVRCMFVASRTNRPFFAKNKLYGSASPSVKLNEFYRYPFESVFDEKIENPTFYLSYPAQYSSKSWWHVVGNQISRVYNNAGEITYSFPMNDTLFVYDLEGYLQKKACAASRYFESFPPKPISQEEEDNPEKLIAFVIQVERYISIIYDPFLDRYYRIVKHRQPLESSSGNKNNAEDAPWSIIVLDAHLNILHEQKFSPGLYDFNDIIVTKEGVLVRNNYYHSKQKRDVIEYTLLKIVQ